MCVNCKNYIYIVQTNNNLHKLCRNLQQFINLKEEEEEEKSKSNITLIERSRERRRRIRTIQNERESFKHE